ncbi:unnamed protein product [Peronospora belbahrii]|uniref:3'-5' exonuclease domain-containing protein n=1 Tax=Peronospora belbahrii TaxID=622444 RepID=A0AAU9KN74_9STRA|nr:unnamed protein product [Peronospora belbahrii]CAH0514764.1 unnamed protein product [Peronospora belbahrii]
MEMTDKVNDTGIKSEALVERHKTLAQLFDQMRLHEAMIAMSRWHSGKLHSEIVLAFVCVAHSPSCLLHCVDLYSQLPGKQVAFVSHWIEAAVALIKICRNPQISSSDSRLAGSMLPALKRARIPFVADFALAYRVGEKDLTAFCYTLVKIRVELACSFMRHLRMKHLLPTEVVLDHVIKQKDFRTGDMFVKGHRENQKKFVQMMIDYDVQDKVIKKRVTLFKLKASTFPVYFERRQKATLRFLIYSKEYEQALQFVEDSADLKFYACKMIVRHAGPEEPATKHFIFRAGMADQFSEVDTSAEDCEHFKNQDELTPLGTCLSLASAVNEANIFFVDTPAALQTCADYLMSQPAVGFDSEWKAVHISTGLDGGPAKCALVQLASREKVFVVDVMALYNHGNILAPVFESDSVVKLGFDTRGDVKALRSFLTGRYATDNVMSMLVDLQTVARKLFAIEGTAVPDIGSIDDVNKGENIDKSEVSIAEQSVNSSASYCKVSGSEKKPRKWRKRYSTTSDSRTSVKLSGLGLAAIAETYLGLPLDKRARMSDWERRPLTQAQLHYAALDAHVLIQIYYKMQEQHQIDTFEAVVKGCTQKRVK